ncbi:MAG TPA: SRPBCC domain-containing protein [Albitalea sp.]|uniref:SRPBCC family protein n=1 Tax=Piscinibacter sp. TaxID=1903157 RepID=UPI002ED4714A
MTEAPRVEVAGLAITGELWLAAPPARVFRALTTPELLEAWWGDAEVYTTHDWQLRAEVGTSWRCEVRLRNGRRHHIDGRVLEVVPERRLRLSWRPSWDASPLTEVRFELEAQRGGTLLALHHGGFRPDFTGLETHRVGWPWVLAWLQASVARVQPGSSVPGCTRATTEDGP